LRKGLSCWLVPFVVFLTLGVSFFDASVVSAQHQQAELVLKKTVALAKRGYAINTKKENIKLGSTAAEVKQKYGQPDFSDSPTYLVYSEKRLEFFLEETMGIPDNQRRVVGRVVGIVTTDHRYENITYQQVKTVLARYPKVSEVKGEDAVYVTYRVGFYFLTFAFYYDRLGQDPDTIKEVHIQKQASS